MVKRINADAGCAGNVSLGAMAPFGRLNVGPNTPRYDFNGSGGYLSSGGTGGAIDCFSVTLNNGPPFAGC
ncbi:hypothetical protein [Burkholderia sp. BCC0322]|uniref:hypothetical protein n=1 Tax=unclassified Burkholderia TaxID=2613784 RepID=UPI00158AD6D3|nr:hypothetical protein [Burkholderia sp. BCC0322]